MKTRKFHLGDVLSATTGYLVSLRDLKGVCDILNFLTGDELYTHQLPRALNECRPFLLKQFPQLKAVDISCVNKENWRQWLAEQVAKYGEELTVRPIPRGAHKFVKDSGEELAEMIGDRKKVTVIHVHLNG